VQEVDTTEMAFLLDQLAAKSRAENAVDEKFIEDVM
jgi:hypothetical protein